MATKRGESSLYLDGGGAYAAVGPTADFNFAKGDFTIEFFANCLDAGKAFLLSFVRLGLASDQPFFAIESVGHRGDAVRFRVHWRIGGVDLLVIDSPSETYRTIVNRLTHFAIVRAGSKVTFYVGGTPYGSATLLGSDGAPLAVSLAPYTMYLGRSFQAGSSELQSMTGYIDDVRIQKSAEWTDSFVPYANQYSPRFTAKEGGLARVFGSFTAREGGSASTGLRRFQSIEGGAAVTRNAYAAKEGGSAHTFVSTSAKLQGQSNTIERRFTSVEGGGSGTLNSYSAKEGGSHRTLTTRFESVERGSSTTRTAFSSKEGGSSSTRAAFSAKEGGRSNTENAAMDRYELYHALDGPIDFDSPPLAVSTTLPMTTPPLNGPGIHRLAVRRRNRFGGLSRNIFSQVFELSATNVIMVPRPRNPIVASVYWSGAGKGTIVADYEYGADGSAAADTWRVYAKIGNTTPPSDADLVATVPMTKADGVARIVYEHTFTGYFLAVAAARASDSRRSDIMSSLLPLDIIEQPTYTKMDFIGG